MATAIANGEGLDYSWGRLSAAQILAAQKHFAARYLYADGEGGKGLDKDEYQGLQGGGVEVPMIYEGAAQRALDGFAAGVVDAQAAVAQLAAVGAPSDMPVYFAVDFDITDAQKPVAGQYLKGVASVIGLPRVGTYGGYWWIKYAVENGLTTYRFQTYAWSGGQWYDGNHLEQYQNGQTIDGQAVDFTRACQENYGQPSKFGGAVGTPAPAPAPVDSSDLITLGADYAGYTNAANAASGQNSNSTVTPGTYKVTVRAQGMVNVVRLNGTGGWWINPNGATTGAPATGLAVGDSVTISNPVDENGTHLNVSGTYTVMEIDGSRIVVGRGGAVTAALDISHLSKVGSGGTVASSGAQYVTVQSGWGLSNIAQAAGYADAGSEARWAAIAALNGSSDWRAYNAALKPNTSVRVR